ncbi:uncharacterized protein LOC108199888 [Daucus carota subsp. sativus]|uniref:FYVE-type domain-containing protein n=2 Tax=Daucus carota subsp. sativus TaxID=79200 RepID=A0A175YLZ2_DAUCS|nr:PREDICTED: uncharacterized protein LOC108199888 [Daucus carota subsp. sativus]
MEIKSDQLECLESRVSDLFITNQPTFISPQDSGGLGEDEEGSSDTELSPEYQLSGVANDELGCSMSPKVTAIKECIEQPEYSGLRSDEERFEEQTMGEVEIRTTQISVKDNEIADSKSLKISGTKDSNKNSFDQSAVVENCSGIGQKVAGAQECNVNIPQSVHNDSDDIHGTRSSSNLVIPKVDSSKECLSETRRPVMKYENEDSRFAATKSSENEMFDVNIPQGLDDKNSEDKRGKYFYYDPPLFEETGVWIPVSVPPMSKTDHEEWTRGFGSNGGTFPEEDMGWGDLFAVDKELTMWDVVVEMLLAAKGKVNEFASGDIPSISLMSGHIVEQAWKEMAQTLAEVNHGKSQMILQTDPPKWLPDSSASSCMLCSVRFHPIMCTRHHCRFCGGIFCSECTKGRMLLPEKFRVGDPQRVCDVCYVRLESVQPYLMDQISRAAQLPTHDLTDLSTLRSWLNFPWGQSMEYEIYKATNTIRGYNQVGSLRPERSIPDAILRQAKGLAILTVMKVGMMVTYNIGTGLVIARREDGSWSPPSAISSFGMGWGAQAGGEFTDYIIVLRSIEAVKTFSGDLHLSVGAGLSAAVGIVGRTAEADVRAGSGGYAACYTYSCSKGAYVGCSLEGSVMTTRVKENSRFYGSQSLTASDILLGSLPKPPAAATMYRALADLYQKFDI